jgi:hypothetical protein
LQEEEKTKKIKGKAIKPAHDGIKIRISIVIRSFFPIQ